MIASKAENLFEAYFVNCTMKLSHDLQNPTGTLFKGINLEILSNRMRHTRGKWEHIQTLKMSYLLWYLNSNIKQLYCSFTCGYVNWKYWKYWFKFTTGCSLHNYYDVMPIQSVVKNSGIVFFSS